MNGVVARPDRRHPAQVIVEAWILSIGGGPVRWIR